jgi:hypothetical protein
MTPFITLVNEIRRAPGRRGTGRTHAHVELGGESYIWDGPHPYVRLDTTQGQVAHILALRT